MTARNSPPFRADHVGSLLRPPELLEARLAFTQGRILAEELRAAEDTAIAKVVRMQEEIGLQSATDGEFRRTSWHMDFIYELGGMTKADEHLEVEFKNLEWTISFSPAALRVTDRVRLDHTIFGDDFTFLAASVTEGTAKLTIPSPSMLHYRGGRAAIDEPVIYASAQAKLEASATAEKAETGPDAGLEI